MGIFHIVFWLLTMVDDHKERDRIGAEGFIPDSTIKSLPARVGFNRWSSSEFSYVKLPHGADLLFF